MATAGIAISSPATPITTDVGMCYQLGATGTITNFAGGNYITLQISSVREGKTASAAVTGLTPGAYTVGMCARNSTTTPINNNDWVNGFVMLLN